MTLGIRAAWTGLLIAAALVTVVPQPGRAGDTGDLPGIVLFCHADGIDDVSAIDLKRVFLSLTDEVSGTEVKAVNLSDPTLKLPVLARLSMMSAERVQDHFVELELRGEGKWPPEVDSIQEMVGLILKSKKVLGWATTAEFESLPERQRKILKIVSIDGHRPGDPEYMFAQ